jgi:hypothetical protein
MVRIIVIVSPPRPRSRRRLVRDRPVNLPQALAARRHRSANGAQPAPARGARRSLSVYHREALSFPDDDHPHSLRRRRIAALLACAAVLVGMPAAFIGWGSDPEALYTVIAIAMVLGVFVLGLVAVMLRCPRCGHGFVGQVFGGLDGEHKHMSKSIAALLKPLVCAGCGLEEHGR